jgi:hypothetical protein
MLAGGSYNEKQKYPIISLHLDQCDICRLAIPNTLREVVGEEQADRE